MSSAHHLTEANIWPKFKENPSRGIGDMERTQNSRLKPMTLTCDLDFELAWCTWVLHIDLLRRTFDQSLMKIFQRVQEIWSGQESVTEGHTDGWTDRWTDRQMKAISIMPHPLRGWGLKIATVAAILYFQSEQFFAIFDLQVTLMLSTKFRVSWPFGSGEEAQNRFPSRPSWI